MDSHRPRLEMADKYKCWSPDSSTLPSTLSSPTIAAQELDIAALSLDDLAYPGSPSGDKGKHRSTASLSSLAPEHASLNQVLDMSVLVCVASSTRSLAAPPADSCPAAL